MTQTLRYMFILCSILIFPLTACDLNLDGSDDTPDENPDGGNPNDASLTGLAVGSPCASDDECTGPGVPQCLTEGIFPLKDLASSDNATAQGFAELGFPMPDGYCSTVPPCTDDGDCGAGGTCFFPLRDVDPDEFESMVSVLGLTGDDLTSILAFLDYGQCLEVCETAADCTRDGYACMTPMADMLALVDGADLSTFCVGTTETCDPNPCVHGACSLENGLVECACESGWEGDLCDTEIYYCNALTPDAPLNVSVDTTEVGGTATYSCDANYTLVGNTTRTCTTSNWSGTEPTCADCDDDLCVNAIDCDDTPSGYVCNCEEGWDGTNCDIDISTPTTTCTLTYAFQVGNGNDGESYTGSNMRIRDTLGNIGDDTYAVGPGQLIIRVPSDGGQNIDPTGGMTEVLYYELTVNFTTTTGGEIVTELTAASPEDGEDTGTMERALGTLSMSATPTIIWNSCTYDPETYDLDNSTFTPDVVGIGEGCLSPYRSVGIVTCNAAALVCTLGNLAVGPNEQNETWEQKLETLTFDAELTSFTMPFMQVPNRSPSRTYVSWGGTRTSIVCQ